MAARHVPGKPQGAEFQREGLRLTSLMSVAFGNLKPSYASGQNPRRRTVAMHALAAFDSAGKRSRARPEASIDVKPAEDGKFVLGDKAKRFARIDVLRGAKRLDAGVKPAMLTPADLRYFVGRLLVSLLAENRSSQAPKATVFVRLTVHFVAIRALTPTAASRWPHTRGAGCFRASFRRHPAGQPFQRK